jgi:hypothetical protein
VGDEIRALRLQVAGHPGDVRIGSQLTLDLLDLLSSGRRGGRGVLEEHDHARVPIAVRLQPVARLDALRRRIVGAVGRELVGDPATERGGDDEEHGGEDHRAPAVALSE